MRTTLLAVVVILISLGAIGCAEEPETAAGAQPPIFVPVGPIPGYGVPPKVQSDPYIGQPAALADGRRLFVWYNCAGCHGGHAGGGMGPSLRDSTWIYGDTDAQIFSSIAQGRGKGMPAWGLKVPQDQIWQLVAYIKSLGTSQEPDPPE